MTYPASVSEHFESTRQELRDSAAPLIIQLNHLAGQLQVPRARSFVNEGIVRRIEFVRRALDTIYAIYPPIRAGRLSADELADIGINLQAFGINVYGVFDNVAWVCMLEGGGNLNPMKVGMFKSEIAPFLPDDLRAHVAKVDLKQWFSNYAKRYRDSTAHRIPPYLPPSSLTSDEAAQAKALIAEATEALSAASAFKSSQDAMAGLDRYGELMAQVRAMGSNSQYAAISGAQEDAPPVQFHPQLLSDWMSVQELLRVFLHGMAKKHGLAVVALPEMKFGRP